MVFSSLVFIVYFLPISIAVYYLLKTSRGAKNTWLVVVSLFFYAWGEPSFVLILLLSVFANYLLLIAIDKTRANRRRSRQLTIVTCALNLAVLFACKQLFQIIGSIEFVLSPSSGDLPAVAIPIGISFFTLRTISFAIDVFRGKTSAPRNPLDAALFITFFPTLVAGPVMRYSEMKEQIRDRCETWQGFSSGVCRFITGLAKKVLIAGSMTAISDHVFSYSAMSNEVTQVPATLAWIGAAAFALQIYYDLSGYSDMAVGLGRMFGFELKENFDYPFASVSLTEFWSRWNVSLIGWFREYIYFPLGGSLVKNNDKMVRNIFILWLMVGLWHGGTWTFIMWGVWQFLFVVTERVINFDNRKIAKPIRRIYVIILVVFGFVIFRTDDIYQATLYFSNMLGLNHNGFFSDTAVMFLREFWLFIAAGILFATPVARKVSAAVQKRKWGGALIALYPVLMLALFFAAAVYIVRGINYPFIYFRF